jgi:hypothetical protein
MAIMLLGAIPVLALEVETELDRTRVTVGDEAILSIKVTGADGIEVQSIPEASGLSISYRGTSRSFQWINGRTWSGIVLSFAIQPQRSGTFTVPPIGLRIGNSVYRSRAVQLVAIQGASQPKAGAMRGHSATHLVYRKTEVAKNRVYAGEPIIVRYYLLHSGIQFDRMPVLRELPETKWCVQRHIEERIDESLEKHQNAEMVKTHLATFLLIPTMKGRQIIRGGEVVVSYISDEGLFPFPRQARVNLEETEVDVVPLPDGGKPKDFSGNVGSFTMNVEFDKKPMKVFDETRLRVVIKGSGNFITMSPPVFEEPKGVKVVRGVGDAQLELKGNSAEGIKEFTYTIIPERSGEIDAGVVQFNFFDSSGGTYRTLVSEKIVLSVQEDGSRGGLEAEERRGASFDINLLWIAFIVLGVAGLMGGMIYWERKKYQSYIKNKENNNTKNIAVEKNAVSSIDAYTREVIMASSAKPEDFLKTAERVLSKLADMSASRAEIPERLRNAIRALKESVYNIRYGGYSIGQDEMKDIASALRGIMRELKEIL